MVGINEGIHLNLHCISVLYKDHAGIWAPLERLYYSTSSKILISRHPMETIEEVISSYCPQCMTRYNEEESFQLNGCCPTCFQCPHCSGILVRNTRDQVGTIADLICTSCHWQTQKCVFDPKSLNSKSMTRKSADLPIEIWSNFHDPFNPTNDGKSYHVWRLDDLENKLVNSTRKDCSGDFFSSHTSTLNSKVDSLGISFRTKRTVRCRHDFETGKMNILVQSKQSPLDGDTSMKLQKGKWWIKDSSAIHDVPFLSVIRVERQSDNCSNWFIDLRITNPRDSEVNISIRPNPFNEDFYFYCDDIGNFQWNSAAAEVLSPAPRAGTDDFNIVLRGYEDELLRDDGILMDKPKMDDFFGRSYSMEWLHFTEGNKGYIRIPLTSDVEVNHKLFELSFCLTWGLNEEVHSTDVKIKVM